MDLKGIDKSKLIKILDIDIAFYDSIDARIVQLMKELRSKLKDEMQHPIQIEYGRT